LVDNVRKISSLYLATPSVKYYDLWTTIMTAAKSVNDSFPDKDLVLSINISENQYRLAADKFFIDVFFSLLHNSMKFDTSEKVEVEIHVEEIKHTPFLRIEVIDHGSGIPDEEKESLFDKVSHRRESIVGLGLGLSLVKMVLDNYGAYINIEDRVPEDHTQGVKFIILMRQDQENDAALEVEK
jgi:K+-sensing histidine kinase KdpD